MNKMGKKFRTLLLTASLAVTTIVTPVMAAELANSQVSENEILTEETADVEAGNGTSFEQAYDFAFGTDKVYDGYFDMTHKVDDARYYKFTLPQSGVVSICPDANNKVDINIYNASKKLVTGTSEDFATVANLKGGTYYVAAEYHTTENQPNIYFKFYMLYTQSNESFVENDSANNDSIGKANVIAYDKSYTGFLADNDTQDYYKLDAATSGRITFDVSGVSIEDITVRLLDKDGNELSKEDCNFPGGKGKKTYAWNVTKGTYYASVEKNSSYGVYSIASKFATAGESFEETGYGTNNNRDAASAIVVDKTYKGQIAITDKADFYKFTLAKEYDILVEITSDMSILDGVIYGADGSKVQFFHSRANSLGVNKYSKTYTLSAGTYYFAVEKNSGKTGNYSFTLTQSDRGAATGFTMFAKNDGCQFFKNAKGDIICTGANGKKVIDEFKCDGTYTYFFQHDGTAMKDRLTYHPDGKHVIYFDENGHEVFSNFHKISKSIAGKDVDDLCFFDVYGHMYVDVMTYDKTGKIIYYINPYGVMERKGWFGFSETCTWAGTTKKVGTGIGYANADGSLLINSNATYNGVNVYMQGDGHMK